MAHAGFVGGIQLVTLATTNPKLASAKPERTVQHEQDRLQVKDLEWARFLSLFLKYGRGPRRDGRAGFISA